MTNETMRSQTDALATAFALLDSFAGEGLGHVYGNGTSLDADDVVVNLCTAFEVQSEPGWERPLATRLIAALQAQAEAGCACAEVAGENPQCALHGIGTLWAKENPDICELAERLRPSQAEPSMAEGEREPDTAFPTDEGRPAPRTNILFTDGEPNTRSWGGNYPAMSAKQAQAGTMMLRRADAMGAVRKLIRFAHSASDKVGSEGRASDFLEIRKMIAGYYEVLSALSELPSFRNPAPVNATTPAGEQEGQDG